MSVLWAVFFISIKEPFVLGKVTSLTCAVDFTSTPFPTLLHNQFPSSAACFLVPNMLLIPVLKVSLDPLYPVATTPVSLFSQ